MILKFILMCRLPRRSITPIIYVMLDKEERQKKEFFVPLSYVTEPPAVSKMSVLPALNLPHQQPHYSFSNYAWYTLA